jgi:hypothetical protein
MITIGQIDYCGKIIFDNELDKRLIEKEELLLRILPLLLSSSYFENTLNLINYALNKTENEIILFPAIASLLLKSDTKNKKRITLIESFFLTQLEKAIKLNLDSLIATSHYNLGNFYRCKNKHHKSISHYVKAKKYDSNYLKRSYYYREIAGVCFEVSKYQFSANFYQKSISLGASNETKSLLGDALMFSGEYKKADEIFNQYISETENLSDEFLLKSLVLGEIIEEINIKSQKRKQKEADELADIINNSNSKKEEIINVEKALKKDLLSGLAWFNLGILKKEKEDFVKASQCFAFSALINLGDIEAWVNAFLSFLNAGKKGNLLLGSLILKTAYYHNRDEFLMNLYAILEENNKSNNEIISMIDNILVNENGIESKSSILRILGGDDKYNEIELR